MDPVHLVHSCLLLLCLLMKQLYPLLDLLLLDVLSLYEFVLYFYHGVQSVDLVRDSNHLLLMLRDLLSQRVGLLCSRSQLLILCTNHPILGRQSLDILPQ